MEPSLLHALQAPWPWWVAGPALGLIVFLLLTVGGRMFGVSSSFQHVCAATIPGDTRYFRYDWRKAGTWNLLFVAGAVLGGLLGGSVFANPEPMALSPRAIETFEALGVGSEGFVPASIFSLEALGDWRSLVILVGGGFLVGFGARWAGGCTSGHAISGLATLQPASLIAVVGFFAGGLLTAHLVLPLLLGG
jgi:uncharacterized membrane protein YedE/YeeE